jgi:nucleoid-associated protein YgaU
MIHRDLKIGFVLGLILVIGVVIKLATDPHLSPQARWEQPGTLQQSARAGELRAQNDMNEVSQNYLLSDISLGSEQSELLTTSPSDGELIAQDLSLNNLSSPAQLKTLSQKDILEQSEPSQKGEFRHEDTTRLSQLEGPSSDNVNNKPPSEELKAQNEIDYDHTEKIKTERFYIVGKNQTLSEISRLYYGSASQWQKIVDANPSLLKDPNKIKPGMKLIIP